MVDNQTTMNPNALMHGTDYAGQQVDGWLAAEKLDGWRAYWDGSRLWTRQGKPYAAPRWFLAALPSFPLDCELVARESTSASKVQSLVQSGDWGNLVLRPLLAPDGRDISALPGAVQWTPVCDLNSAVRRMQEVQMRGGEGIMLRKPGTAYTPGRSNALLKLKTFLPQ